MYSFEAVFESTIYMNALLTWLRHQMETFSALLVFCVGNSSVTSEFPAHRLVTRSFDVFLICTWTNSWANNGDAGDLSAIGLIMTSL